MDELSFRKLRNVISTSPRTLVPWRELVNGKVAAPADKCEANVDKLRALVLDFLELVSGGEIVPMLSDILHPSQSDQIPSLSGYNDSSGRKRLDKLNTLIQKSPPLKPWPIRDNSDSKIRLEVEVTARRCLSYLSGGHIVSILRDILYENEKEALAEKYRLAIVRIGEVMKHIKPKPKGIILNAVRQSGFTKDDLREKGWTFSTNLWKSSSHFGPSFDSFPLLVPRLHLGVKKASSSSLPSSRPMMQSHVITSIRRRRRSRQFFDTTDEEDQVTTIRTASNSTSPFKSGARMMTLNSSHFDQRSSFFDANSPNNSSSSSDDEDEEEARIVDKRKLKTAMFPQIY